jgi:hypothetical protein
MTRRKEWQLPVTMFFIRKQKEITASTAPDSESPDRAFCYYKIVLFCTMYIPVFVVLLSSCYLAQTNTLNDIQTDTYTLTVEFSSLREGGRRFWGGGF